MSKPAKGPWKSDTDNWILDGEGRNLAFVSGDLRSREEVYATRDIMAASFEMLDALRAVEICLSDEPKNIYFLNIVLAAISKAEGRKS